MKLRHIDSTTGDAYLNESTPIYINRVYESFEIGQHTHDFIELNYVTMGRGFHYINDEMIPVVKGDLFLLPVGTSHVFRPSSAKSDSSLSVYNCVFRVELLERWNKLFPVPLELFQLLSSEKPNTSKPWIHFKDTKDEFEPIFFGMHNEFNQQSSGYQILLHTQLIQILTLLHRHLSIPEQPPTVASRLEQAFQYIQEHYQDHLTLEEIIAVSNLSKSQFQRVFKKVIGQTFTVYLQNLRIEKSCRLLRTNSLTVQHIANLVGYEDLKFFHALFKKKTGLTPRQYRVTQ